MKKIIFFIIIIAVLFGLFKLTSSDPTLTNSSDDQADLILFWGEGCPHCETVKKYITDNSLDTKVKISYKEVYSNQQNQQLLTTIVKGCPEIDSSSGIGVPLAFDKKNSRCLYGDQPIIDWLSQK